MSALDELKRMVEAREQAAQAARDKRTQELLDDLREKAVAEFGQALLDELRATFIMEHQYAVMCLNYRNMMSTFRPADGWRKGIVDWVKRVDTQWEEWSKKRAEMREELLSELPKCEIPYWLSHHQHSAHQYDLMDDPEIAAVFELATRRVAQHEEERQAAEQLEEARLQAERDEEMRMAVERIDQVMLGDELKYTQIPYNLEGATQVQEAMSRARRRVHENEELRVSKRAELQAAEFVPFVFYRAHYGIVATDLVDDEPLTYIETRFIDCLSDAPDSSGWWHPVGRSAVRMMHLVKVERVEVETHEDMPNWCPMKATEWGAIQVPPEGAEKIA